MYVPRIATLAQTLRKSNKLNTMSMAFNKQVQYYSNNINNNSTFLHPNHSDTHRIVFRRINMYTAALSMNGKVELGNRMNGANNIISTLRNHSTSSPSPSPSTSTSTSTSAYDIVLPNIQLFRNAVKHLNSTAISSGGKSYTYKQLLDDALSVKNSLLTILTGDGVNGGINDLAEQRIGFLLSPSYEYVVMQWGIWLAGGVAIPLHHSLPPPQIQYILNDSQTSLLVTESKYASILQPISDTMKLSNPLLDIHQLIQNGKQQSASTSAADIAGNRRAQLIYTSGTTGNPKGVVSTHSVIEHQAKSLVDAWEYTSNDHMLHVLPLHHVHGIMNALLAILYAGGRVTFLPKFDPAQVWSKFVELDDLNVFTAVPTIYSRLIKCYNDIPDEREKVKLRAACQKFRLMMCGSAALPISVLNEWRQISGHTLLERYGMTEIGMALSNPLHGERKPGYVGKPLPYVKVRVQPLEDDEDGDTDAVNGTTKRQRGELLVSGGTVFNEYWNLPEITKKEFTDDGYFRTGDVVEVNESGEYRIVGRASVDIIKSAGNKISALAIEQVLIKHPAISELAVVGLPDKEYGQLISVVAAVKDGQALDLEQLKQWCKGKLQVSETPRKLFILNAIPRNAMGKINKKQLIKQFQA